VKLVFEQELDALAAAGIDIGADRSYCHATSVYNFIGAQM
jgi:hypothetical protein